MKQFPTVKKRKNRTDYNKNYKKKQRLDPAYKTFEQILQCNYKQTARQNPVFKANEISYQGKSKQKLRQDPVLKQMRSVTKDNQNGKQDKILYLKQKKVQPKQTKDKIQPSKQMRSVTKANQNGKQDTTLYLKQKSK